MNTETFTVKNIKCGGCVKTVQNGLLELDGVSTVEATTAGEVMVQGANPDRARLAARLIELGYPPVDAADA